MTTTRKNTNYTSVLMLTRLFFQVLVAEIEQKQGSIDECQKYSEQYSSAIKVRPLCKNHYYDDHRQRLL